MPEYRVYFQTTASTYVDVEADDPTTASDLAEEVFDPPTLCHQCAGGVRRGAAELYMADWEPCDDPPEEIS